MRTGLFLLSDLEDVTCGRRHDIVVFRMGAQEMRHEAADRHDAQSFRSHPGDRSGGESAAQSFFVPCGIGFRVRNDGNIAEAIVIDEAEQASVLDPFETLYVAFLLRLHLVHTDTVETIRHVAGYHSWEELHVEHAIIATCHAA